MSTLLLAFFVCLPALLAPLVVVERTSHVVFGFARFAAAPVLLLAALPIAYPAYELRWLLLGTTLELDAAGRLFLLVAAGLWTAAGLFAWSYLPVPERGRFYLFFLLTMTGNLGLPLAADSVTFYLFFAIMTFAGYGLVIHVGGGEARRAGRVYLTLALAGEAFLLAGVLMASYVAGGTGISAIPAAVAASPLAGWVTACLLIGFGIKAGAVPLHVWLPLAHPVAPTPASAVLSGSMIKAGLLGWIRFLPLGEGALPGWGTLMIGLGIVAAFFGVLIGVVQSNAKTVLAYSSISQMGLMNVGIGVALVVPEAAPAAVPAVIWYAAHHGLAKGALFLGVGVAAEKPASGRSRAMVTVGLLLPALAIAGAPLTSGSVAKGNLKGLLPFAPMPWAAWLEWLLPLSAVATSLLMARYLHIVMTAPAVATARLPRRGLILPWVALLAAGALALRVLPRWYPVGDPTVEGYGGSSTLAVDTLAVAAGGILFWLLIHRWWRPDPDAHPPVAPGDMVVPVERLLGRLRNVLDIRPRQRQDWVMTFSTHWYRLYAESDRRDRALRLELALTRWVTAIFAFIALSGLLVWLLAI